ncbi:TPR-like protein [Athelia psychrophila]|uniref:TPR-like protein n=1 Tax=Athelia psychrophila TaxID=1759441 RepID=A0A166HWU5_9AGAM|nr:TPR-like protein [Fibularhizoctonia sp. CBS 109695]
MRQQLAHIGPGTAIHPPPSPLPNYNDAPDLISPCFTGRSEEFQLIADALGSATGRVPARCAIWGMPGLGKSQTALKYAHSSFDSGRHTHVFWIAATTVEKLTQGLAKVLRPVQHLERYNSDQAAQLMAARCCFEHSEEYGFLKWLIIIDSATSETVAFLRQNLPRQNANGCILITTRTLDVAEALTNVAGHQYPVCELKALSPIQSAELLLKTAGIPSSAAVDLDSAQKLVERMGCLPLAVEQAGAFMKQNAFQSASRLNNLYDKHGWGEMISWTNSLTTYEETSVLAAFTAPLQRLGAINPDVLSFLRVMACLDPEIIPLDIVVIGAEKAREHLASHMESTSLGYPAPKEKSSVIRRLITKLPWKHAKPRPLTVPKSGNADTASSRGSLKLRPLLESICSDKWLRGACRHLQDLSLARPLYGDALSLHIHDLIQQVIIQQTPMTHELGEDPYHALAVTVLFWAFEAIEDPESPQCWPECERFVPHIMALTKHVGAPPINLLDELSVRLARYFQKRGRYDEATALCQHALAGQTQQLGADHPNTLTTVHRLADVYVRQGTYIEAEALYRRALAGREQQLGGIHRDTLSTVNNLAWLYQIQAKYNEAEALHQRALAGREQKLGADHQDTLKTVHNLAALYYQQGKYDEAERLYQRALVGQTQQLGADHSDTLTTANNLAGLHADQGKYAEAETLYQRALLGAGHPSTLSMVNNLAALYYHQGNYDEAEAMYQRALAGKERQLGAEHPSTLGTVNNLALLYRHQGKHEEADALFRRGLAGAEQQLGEDHPDTLRTVNNLAALYYHQGKYAEAEALYRRALAGCEQQLGAGHPSTLNTEHNIALLYEHQGKYDEAGALYKRALAGREISLGTHHPDTIDTMKGLGRLYGKQGRDEEANTLSARAEEAEKVR